VGRALRSRNTPQLTFERDELQDRARRLTALIDEVAPPADSGGNDVSGGR